MDDVGPVATKQYAISQFSNLNQLTLSRFTKLIKDSGFSPIHLTCEQDSFLAVVPLLGNLFRTGIKGVFFKRK
jgi:hypothetical protein